MLWDFALFPERAMQTSDNNPVGSGPQFQLDLNPEHRRVFLAECNRTLNSARDRMIEDSRSRGGLESCRRFSAEMDEVLRQAYDWLVKEAQLAAAEYSRIAVIAQGGYGRAELNPRSDIDLLFLMPEAATPVEQAFVRSFLYILWDLNKLEVGYGAKQIDEALSAIGADLDSTTALIEMRLIAGNQAMLDELGKKLFKMLHNSNQRWFTTQKFVQWNVRREKYGSSVYLLEPNVKEGEGGLRDVHSMQWLSYALLGSSNLQITVEKDVLKPDELSAVMHAVDFLLSVRTVLHHLEGRKVDVLSFDKQPAVAAALGYESDGELLAEEKLMKHYYLHARTIDRYSQKVARVLTSRARNMMAGFLEVVRRRKLEDLYYVHNGVLMMKAPSTAYFAEKQSRVMRSFYLCAKAGAVMSEELKDVIMDAGVSDDEEFRTSPDCRSMFMKMLSLKKNVAPALHAMHDTGVLADYIPEFHPLFCLARIDHYHRYTVDEHLLKAVEIAEDLLSEQTTSRHELAAVAREIKRWDLLILSVLLHDIGKGLGHGHVLRGGILSQQITQRMGLTPEDQEVVRQLILQHLRLSHTSQRRDLEDPRVIAQTAAAVPDPELLRMLYILTYCDTQAVGPGAWTDWKATLLYELYRKTMLALEGKDPIAALSDESRKQVTRELTECAAGEFSAEDIKRFVRNAPDKYITSAGSVKMLNHMHMLRRLSREDRVVWELSEPPHLNYTEITAVAYDVPGLMSYLCGAFASKDINILSMQVFSTKDGYAIDTFQVTDLHGNKLPHGFRLDRLLTDLNQVLLGKAQPTEVFPARRKGSGVRRDVSSLKPTQVLIDNDASADYTVLEVKTSDRPGLLYSLTSTCAELDYYIHLAMITTEAYRVVDVFYITDLENNKLEDQQVRKLTAALEQAAGQ